MNKPDFAPYLNRWIAVAQGRVAGVGSTRQQAYRAAKRVRPKDRATLLFINSQGNPLTVEQTWFHQHKLLQNVADILQERRLEACLVGGAVRDLLLERENIVDLDFAVPTGGINTARLVANALNASFYPLDVERDTGRVVCEIGTPPTKFYLDFAAFRGASLKADLLDRDFTINAMALSLTASPRLIDPLHGQADLDGHQIKAVTPDAFLHDPVRVLRAIRQAAALNFSLEANTAQHLRRAAPRLPEVSPERQRDELVKLLNTPAPGRAVKMLHTLQVLPHILPEVEAMASVSQSPPHYLDVFEHTVAALDAWAGMRQNNWSLLPAAQTENVERYLDEVLAGDLRQRELMPLAILLHDTGKPLTRTQELVDGRMRVRFFGHEQESANIAGSTMHRLHFSLQAGDFVKAVVANHMRPLLLSMEKTVSRKAIYRLFRATGGAKYQAGVAVALHALADHQATYRPNQGEAQERALLNVVNKLLDAFFEQRTQVVDPPLLLTGHELLALGAPQGRLIGLLLGRLREAQATGEVQDKAAALAFIKSDPDFATSQAEEL